MRMILTVFTVIILAEPQERKEPPAKEELAAITERGRDLAGYDAAAWHGSDALQAKQPKTEASFAISPARSTRSGSLPSAGLTRRGKVPDRLRSDPGREARQVRREGDGPAKEDTGFFLVAAKAIDTSLDDFAEHFDGEQPRTTSRYCPPRKAKSGSSWSRHRPSQTCGRWAVTSAT